MDKVIRILAIVATALVVLSLLLMLITIPFQGLIAQYLLGYPEDVLSFLPQFPLMPFLTTLMRLLPVALLILCCGSKKGGYWLEILVFVALVIVLPPLTSFLTTGYSFVLNNTIHHSAYEVVSSSVVNIISNFCQVPASGGYALAYCACGMSIVYKALSNRKMEKLQDEPLD